MNNAPPFIFKRSMVCGIPPHKRKTHYLQNARKPFLYIRFCGFFHVLEQVKKWHKNAFIYMVW
jgi:hypothetical protein